MIFSKFLGHLFAPEFCNGIDTPTSGESGKICRRLDSQNFGAPSLELESHTAVVRGNFPDRQGAVGVEFYCLLGQLTAVLLKSFGDGTLVCVVFIKNFWIYH